VSIINYAIADDHHIFRQGIRLVLKDEPRLNCIGEAGTGRELITLLNRQGADVVLLDLKMPDMDGIEATQEIRNLFPELKIIVLTMHNDEPFVLHLMELGANGYLVKNAYPEEIIKAIYSVHETNYYFNELVSTTLLRKIATSRKYKPKYQVGIDLTDREKQVLQLICQEKTAVEIGATMYLSPRTIEGIRATLIEKIGVKNVAGLVLYAVRNGLSE
jgi:DNA-binding NarL/FixJ family response regulator